MGMAYYEPLRALHKSYSCSERAVKGTQVYVQGDNLLSLHYASMKQILRFNGFYMFLLGLESLQLTDWVEPGFVWDNSG